MQLISSWRGTVERIGERRWLGSAGLLVQVVGGLLCCLLGGLVAACLGAYVLLPVLGPQVLDTLVPIGLLAGGFGGIVLAHDSRLWAHRRRVRRLRARGLRVLAPVTGIHLLVAPHRSGRVRGVTYVVDVRWTEPATGVQRTGQRLYRFMTGFSPALEAEITQAAPGGPADEIAVPLLYDPREPARFVLDIPFAPTLADFFR